MSELRDGVMKRGRTWSYVIRVEDPETAEGKPGWVSGFATEDEAEAARDEARQRSAWQALSVASAQRGKRSAHGEHSAWQALSV
ncbi:hypothetical protein [Streptosporangium sp. H16]|uniref:hypothetical protein n=1 Tax=Streptosporangium sp. H16 TaxID=3444184 RepID=UPI003F7998E1